MNFIALAAMPFGVLCAKWNPLISTQTYVNCCCFFHIGLLSSEVYNRHTCTSVKVHLEQLGKQRRRQTLKCMEQLVLVPAVKAGNNVIHVVILFGCGT